MSTDTEAYARWNAKRAAHLQLHPDHVTSRDATMGGHDYCRQCNAYITL